MTNKIKQKATRLLKNLQFSSETHNVSLVGPEVGSGANQTKVLLLKQAVKPEETIEVKKALEQITVTLSMEEFLRKFFGMWYDEAELLTKLLGFETEYEAAKKEQEARGEEPWDYSKYLEDKISQFTIMKSMNEGSIESITKSAFNDIVALQQKLEPALNEHITTKEKQMEELELAKSALTAKEAELATQVDLVKSLEAKVTELESQLAVVKAAEEKAEFDAFAAQLKGLVAEEKFETVAKAMYEMNKVSPEAVEVQIEALKAANQKQEVATQVAAEGLTTEQGHNEIKDEQAVQLAKSRQSIFAYIK